MLNFPESRNRAIPMQLPPKFDGFLMRGELNMKSTKCLGVQGFVKNNPITSRGVYEA